MAKKTARTKKPQVLAPVDGDAFNKALAPINLPFTDDALENEVKAVNAQRAEITAEIEKGMTGVSLDEVGAYTQALLKSLAGGKPPKHNPKLEKAMKDMVDLAYTIDVYAADRAEQELRQKSAKKFNDWAGKGAPTAKAIKPLRTITLKPKQP
ncbi:MAG: hypothetical protein ACAH80_00665 [Alphaproteobacteria bacterium]